MEVTGMGTSVLFFLELPKDDIYNSRLSYVSLGL